MLEQCIKICRGVSVVSVQAHHMSVKSEPDVLVVRSKTLECKLCGQRHVAGWKRCPAFGKNCNRCRKKNHFAVKCKVETGRQWCAPRSAHLVAESSEVDTKPNTDYGDDDDDRFLLTVTSELDYKVLSSSCHGCQARTIQFTPR